MNFLTLALPKKKLKAIISPLSDKLTSILPPKKVPNNSTFLQSSHQKIHPTIPVHHIERRNASAMAHWTQSLRIR